MSPLAPDAARFLSRVPHGVHEMTVAQARAFAAAVPGLVGPGPEVDAVKDIPGARVYEPAGCVPATLVYLHGGGWVVGGVDNDDALARSLAVATGWRVVSVEYPLAPEHPFPCGLEDVRRVLGDVAGEPLVLAGDSAGGNLAAVLAHESEHAGLVLVNPLLDHECVSRRRDTALLSVADLEWYWDLYLPDVSRRGDPLASPLRRDDLGSFPPTHIITVEHDPLADQGWLLANRLHLAGVDVRHDHHHDLMHGFLPLVGVVEGAARVIEDIATFVRHLAVPEALA